MSKNANKSSRYLKSAYKSYVSLHMTLNGQFDMREKPRKLPVGISFLRMRRVCITVTKMVRINNCKT